MALDQTFNDRRQASHEQRRARRRRLSTVSGDKLAAGCERDCSKRAERGIPEEGVDLIGLVIRADPQILIVDDEQRNVGESGTTECQCWKNRRLNRALEACETGSHWRRSRQRREAKAFQEAACHHVLISACIDQPSLTHAVDGEYGVTGADRVRNRLQPDRPVPGDLLRGGIPHDQRQPRIVVRKVFELAGEAVCEFSVGPRGIGVAVRCAVCSSQRFERNGGRSGADSRSGGSARVSWLAPASKRPDRTANMPAK